MNKNKPTVRGRARVLPHGAKAPAKSTPHYRYSFETYEHPYVAELVSKLVKRDSVADLLGASIEPAKDAHGKALTLKDAHGKPSKDSDGTPVLQPELYRELFARGSYRAGADALAPHPIDELDFSSGGAYSVYNWELFFHIPLAIGIHLSQNQRYKEAQDWFEYIFDPNDDSDGPTPERFWKIKPFRTSDVKLAGETLRTLAHPTDAKQHSDTINAIQASMEEPFRPFLVARYRQSAFMMKAVMATLDNLIAWGDSLFVQYTSETITESLQLYVQAAHLLGPRPQLVPKKELEKPHTYASLKAHLDQFGNSLVSVESEVPLDEAPAPRRVSSHTKFNAVSGVGRTLYFCTPRNDRLMGYWDTVADRLFKIRNSLNIEGVFQQVPLFDPPIDPALLVRGAAAGLDVRSIVSGQNQPLPIVRFQYLLQKATEICQEAKSLGGNLLSAFEKHDSERLAVMRAQHETTGLKLAESVKYSAWQEALKNREGIEQSLANAAARYSYYERLLGKKASEIKLPKLDPLDKQGLAKLSFRSQEPTVQPRDVNVDVASDLGESGGVPISSRESESLKKSEIAHGIQMGVHVAKMLGSALRPIPDSKLALHFWGIGGDINLPGGTMIADLFNLAADIASAVADQFSYESTRANQIATFANRQRDNEYQSNVAAGDITQLFKQLRAAEIREAMTEQEYKNHQVQIKMAEEVDAFLANENGKGKLTNVAFYAWMKRELKALYGQVFQFAFEVARKTERAMQLELGNPDLSFIQYGYLAGNEGLLAGEKLFFDLKRMEMAYAEQNRREYELTKHVSLLQINPLALVQLRATGSCAFKLDEEIFDLDCPGHYFRRIKTVSLSIPSITGPYSSVNCRLSLQKSSIRQSASLGDDGYPRTGVDDKRFSDYFGTTQAIVTSGGQNDSGLFETNLHDERKLPFESAGAESEWRLDLPRDIRQFDYDTISDVILHVRYSAREGGDAMAKAAVAQISDKLAAATLAGCVRLFDIRHEFPSEWAKLKAAKPATPGAPTAPLTLTIMPEHYPFWTRGRVGAVKQAMLIARSEKDIAVVQNADGTGTQQVLSKDSHLLGLRSGTPSWGLVPAATGPVTISFRDNSLTDLWLAVTWTNGASTS